MIPTLDWAESGTLRQLTGLPNLAMPDVANLQLHFPEPSHIIEAVLKIADLSGRSWRPSADPGGAETAWLTGTSLAKAIDSTVPVAALA
jgi:hypothetical protein